MGWEIHEAKSEPLCSAYLYEYFARIGIEAHYPGGTWVVQNRQAGTDCSGRNANFIGFRRLGYFCHQGSEKGHREILNLTHHYCA